MQRLNELDQGGALILEVFEGEQQVRFLTDVLQELDRNVVTCVVYIKGLLGPTRKLLANAGLLIHFKDVCGSGETYGVTPYDQSVSMSGMDLDGMYLDQKNAYCISKSEVVQTLLASHRAQPRDLSRRRRFQRQWHSGTVTQFFVFQNSGWRVGSAKLVLTSL